MKLSERLEAACTGVLVAEATGNLDIVTDAVNKLLDAAREAAALARRVEDAAVADVEWDGGADLTVYFDGCPDEDLKGCRWNATMSEKLDGQRVRIVPTPNTTEVPHD